MSRNLCRTYCYFCGGDVIHDEPPRLGGEKEYGVYASEYAGMPIANATCDTCGAKYLAWVRGPSSWPKLGHLGVDQPNDNDHVDLSFRSTFNDEAGPDDLPIYQIDIVRTFLKTKVSTCSKCGTRMYYENRYYYGNDCKHEGEERNTNPELPDGWKAVGKGAYSNDNSTTIGIDGQKNLIITQNQEVTHMPIDVAETIIARYRRDERAT